MTVVTAFLENDCLVVVWHSRKNISRNRSANNRYTTVRNGANQVVEYSTRNNGIADSVGSDE